MSGKGATMEANRQFELLAFGARRRMCVGDRMGVLRKESCSTQTRRLASHYPRPCWFPPCSNLGWQSRLIFDFSCLLIYLLLTKSITSTSGKITICISCLCISVSDYRATQIEATQIFVQVKHPIQKKLFISVFKFNRYNFVISIFFFVEPLSVSVIH